MSSIDPDFFCHRDAFARHPTNMSSIDPDFFFPSFVHIPKGPRSKPEEEKVREEKKRAVKAKTAKLLLERFIQEVKYPNWLSNVVMMKKPSDYMDLNKACTKDLYHFPNIDALVDGASSCDLLSFMDAYLGYNQIKMHQSDESKIVFITNEGNFCYRVIVLRRYQLKLNLEKCSFEVKVGKFLGFMLTKRGIKANSEKCNAVIGMRSPKSVKESAPIFQLLKKAERFRWIDEFEAAFQELKTMLASPPILIWLFLCIYISDNAISSVIIQEEKGEQQPIYYVNKVALAIIITARKLRTYFQSHHVICIIGLPIRQILRKPNLVGRMTRWVIELSEFNIAYERRGHMKAQVLTDFINKLTPNSHEEEATRVNREWTLSVDGSSNKKGTKVGVILKGPGMVLIKQSLYLSFEQAIIKQSMRLF
ncbi:Retrovirus-related Pol polyprotein from transposon 17.6, partial [Mucuna pruriens]